MRIPFYLVVIFVVLTLLTFGCDEEKSGNGFLILSGKLVSHSDCKNMKFSEILSDVPDTLSCVECNFDASGNKLYLKHINAGFNCCPESLYCNVSLDNDTIVVREFEQTQGCHCDCLYDLEIEVNGVERKRYYIKFVEPYAPEGSRIGFEIDLAKSVSGSYCIIRKTYPWGMF